MNNQKSFLSLLGLLFVIYIGLFLWFYGTSTTDQPINLYSNTYGIIPLLGGVYGFIIARRWGGWSSAVGRAVRLLSLGLLTWGLGMVIWLYYNLVLGVEIPYPSFADAAFIVSWPLWGFGAAFLSLAMGANFGAKSIKGRTILFIVPITAIVFSYYFLVTIARQGVISTYDDALKTFFDLAYPIGDVVILTITVLIFGLTYKYFGGMYKKAIYLILGGFVMNYFADFMFSYTTSLETYYNGSLADALFVTTMTLLSLGIAMLDPNSLSKESESTVS